MKMIRMEREEGITLIALAITTIVLLILAGAVTSIINGENGILSMASDSKVKTENTSTEEQVKLAVITAFTEGHGNIKGEKAYQALNDSLKEIGYIGEEIDSLPAIVKINEIEYTITTDGTVRETNDIDRLKKSETAVSDNTTLVDINGHSITIPMNFNIASESPVEVKKGMIIEDSDNNQYVWIPIFTKEQYSWGVDYSSVETQTEDTTEYYTAIEKALATYTKTYAKREDYWYETKDCGYYAEDDTEQENLITYKNGNMTQEEYKLLKRNMLKSLYKNGGFYIGRYEMGIGVVKNTVEAQNTSRNRASIEYNVTADNTTNEAPTIEGMAMPISKANAVPYNYITQSQAQMLAMKVGEKADYSNVTTSIMFAVQWNSVCVFIENFDMNNTYTVKSDWLKWENGQANSWGNILTSEFKLDRGFYTTKYSYSTVKWNENYTVNKKSGNAWLCTTGASDRNSSLNIYDLCGNVLEFVLEPHWVSDERVVDRGGSFYGYGAPAPSGGGSKIYYFDHKSGSRMSFYIKDK